MYIHTMHRSKIDPGSPVPLYHQIAELIRARITSGELSPGGELDPLRIAAEKWGVHLHTVRHAYAALAREGLVEIRRGAAGTRVAVQDDVPRDLSAARSRRETAAELSLFLKQFFRDGKARFGLAPLELAEAAGNEAERVATTSPPVVYVTECSAHQCGAHASEIADRYDVDARPWPIDAGEPPPGPVIATYFHYNDIRRLWPRRLHTVRFMTIRPSDGIKEQISRRTGTIRVCEFDVETAEAVVGDVQALLGRTKLKLVPAITDKPASLLRAHGTGAVLFPPRVWAQLDENARQDFRAIELVYTLDTRELRQFAAESGWRDRLLSVAS